MLGRIRYRTVGSTGSIVTVSVPHFRGRTCRSSGNIPGFGPLNTVLMARLTRDPMVTCVMLCEARTMGFVCLTVLVWNVRLALP